MNKSTSGIRIFKYELKCIDQLRFFFAFDMCIFYRMEVINLFIIITSSHTLTKKSIIQEQCIYYLLLLYSLCIFSLYFSSLLSSSSHSTFLLFMEQLTNHNPNTTTNYGYSGGQESPVQATKTPVKLTMTFSKIVAVNVATDIFKERKENFIASGSQPDCHYICGCHRTVTTTKFIDKLSNQTKGMVSCQSQKI